MTLTKLKSTVLLVIAVLALDLDTLAQSTPKYSNEYLSIGVGGRALGMSNSVIASADDVTAGYWNPAGVVKQEDKLQLSFMHSNLYSGIANYDYLGLSTKVKENAAISFSMVRLGVDNIPNTIDLIRNGQINYDRVTSFSSVDYGFYVSYAQKALKDGLSFGGSAKIIRRKGGEFATAWGFGIDASAQYETDNNWQFAIVGRDITTTFNAWKYTFTEAEEQVFVQTGNEIPINSLELTLPKLLLGVAKKFDVNDDFSVLTELNLDLNTDGKRNTLIKSNFISGDPHFGLEAGYKERMFLRGGIGNVQQVKDLQYVQQWTMQPNMGVGLSLKNFVVDYALTNMGNLGAGTLSHVFSVRAVINPIATTK
ncbi:PorV/PorQ family protein [Bacteroidia bacterium]|nr:PorV/PorQ family protein [Bacteroidia bacterium]MDB4107402.1 PorV/PorQ family protein [Bacteroidia bacterium]MDB9883188.1 PorV/PorQ family protein [Bacteroidia bacterium]